MTSAAASSLTSVTPVTPTGDLNPAPLVGGVLGEGGCSGAGETGWRNIFICHSLTAVTVTHAVVVLAVHP